MTTPQNRTLLHHLLETPEVNGASWPRFRVLRTHMAEDAARDLQHRRLANGRVVSESPSGRRVAGTHVARGQTGTILEWFSGKSVGGLAQPVPVRELVRPRPLDRRTGAAARTLDYNWPTSRHGPGEPDVGVQGTWELAGGRHFDGTAIGVQLYEAELRGDIVELDESDLPHLQSFVRSSRRAVVLAALGAAGGPGLYALDAALARQNRPLGQSPQVPLAYR